MDESDRQRATAGDAIEQPTVPAPDEAPAGDTGTTDERPLFATTDDIDPEVTAQEESKDDLALRGAAVAGALGGNAGQAAGALAGHGAALGVNTEAGEPVEVRDEERDDRAPGD